MITDLLSVLGGDTWTPVWTQVPPWPSVVSQCLSTVLSDLSIAGHGGGKTATEGLYGSSVTTRSPIEGVVSGCQIGLQQHVHQDPSLLLRSLPSLRLRSGRITLLSHSLIPGLVIIQTTKVGILATSFIHWPLSASGSCCNIHTISQGVARLNSGLSAARYSSRSQWRRICSIKSSSTSRYSRIRSCKEQ